VVAALQDEARKGDLTIRVVGDCMAPLVSPGADVRIRAARLYWPGDVVAFASRAGELTLHRLIGYRLRGGRLAAITMPDNERHPDASIPLTRVLGRLCGGDCDRRAVDVPLVDRWRALARLARAVRERIGR
jgi:hypothetical protein